MPGETIERLGMIALGAAVMGAMGYLACGRWNGMVGMGGMGAALVAISFLVAP